MTKKRVDELFFLLFCERNSDGTKHLRLKGREIFQRTGSRLNAADMYPLVEFLKKYPEVISLDMSYNNLRDEGVKILAQNFFNEDNNLQDLNLLHCDLQAEGLKWLSSANHLKLKRIRLVGNKLGPIGTQYMGRLIENCCSLETLDVGETDQTQDSIESFLIVVEKSKLKSINISRIIPNSYYSKYDHSVFADNLGVLFKVNKTLESLMVQKCGFDGHDVESLIGGLKINKSLAMLDLTANKIGDDGAQHISQWLKTKPTLIALRIGCNGIGTTGAQVLANAVPFSRLRLLDIHNNNIGDKGLQDILGSVQKSTQMRMLYIWGNNLSVVALSELERMLISGILNQEYIDVKVYYVHGKPQAVYYPTNFFSNRFYSVPNHSFPPELKIVKNKVHHANAQPRALINFDFIDRYPPVDESLGLGATPCQDSKLNESK